MLNDDWTYDSPPVSFEAEQEAAAARDAAAIGGRAGDEGLDPAQRPLIEAGEGVAEGFELSEEDLIEAASHGPSHRDPMSDRFTTEAGGLRGVYGESDHADSSQLRLSDR